MYLGMLSYKHKKAHGEKTKLRYKSIIINQDLVE